MSRVRDFIATHKALLAEVPHDATRAMIDPEIWWLEEVLQTFTDGTLLCLALYVSDTRHKDTLIGEYHLEHRCPDEGFLWGAPLPLTDRAAQHATLKACLDKYQWDVSLADSPAAHDMARFIRALWSQTQGEVRFEANRRAA